MAVVTEKLGDFFDWLFMENAPWWLLAFIILFGFMLWCASQSTSSSSAISLDSRNWTCTAEGVRLIKVSRAKLADRVEERVVCVEYTRR